MMSFLLTALVKVAIQAPPPLQLELTSAAATTTAHEDEATGSPWSSLLKGIRRECSAGYSTDGTSSPLALRDRTGPLKRPLAQAQLIDPQFGSLMIPLLLTQDTDDDSQLSSPEDKQAEPRAGRRWPGALLDGRVEPCSSPVGDAEEAEEEVDWSEMLGNIGHFNVVDSIPDFDTSHMK